MDISLGFAKLLLLNRHKCINLTDQSAQVSAVIIDPPPVKSRTFRCTLLRKRRRTRQRSHTDRDSGDREEQYGLFDGDSGGGGGRGGFGGGDGGRGWNFDKFGGQNWDESSWWSSNFASGFVIEVIYWIALSNCLHFAFKKIFRIVADGFADAGRGKVPMRLATV